MKCEICYNESGLNVVKELYCAYFKIHNRTAVFYDYRDEIKFAYCNCHRVERLDIEKDD